MTVIIRQYYKIKAERLPEEVYELYRPWYDSMNAAYIPSHSQKRKSKIRRAHAR